uniref:BPTI/Kunitz inhibitor domain-containing protein n=1 Tax=Erpetoichthys calabaricus TaxID=27687 RepID=A0A8C4SY03_ERPCA
YHSGGMSLATGTQKVSPTAKTKRHHTNLKIPGTPCKGQLKIQWYFHKSSQTCIPFWYRGCGGNGNRFEVKPRCLEVCAGKGHSQSSSLGGSAHRKIF